MAKADVLGHAKLHRCKGRVDFMALIKRDFAPSVNLASVIFGAPRGLSLAGTAALHEHRIDQAGAGRWQKVRPQWQRSIATVPADEMRRNYTDPDRRIMKSSAKDFMHTDNAQAAENPRPHGRRAVADQPAQRCHLKRILEQFREPTLNVRQRKHSPLDARTRAYHCPLPAKGSRPGGDRLSRSSE